MTTRPALLAGIFLASLPAAAWAQTVTRGPYLQQGTDTAVTVRWRTSSPAVGVVRYGTRPAALTLSASESSSRTEHEVRLTGLSPDTRYYYSIGTPAGTLAGGDADHFFITAPRPGTPKPTRVWVLGDPGTATSNQRAVRDAYSAFTGSRHTDLWLMLGDNAYSSGTDAEYQRGVFDIYPTVLRRSVLWPTLGNHDAVSADSATQTGPYYDIFTLPKNGEAGGIPSGTEAYYSFDYANIHFVCLDSQDTSRSPAGAMATWLKNDLAVTTADWIVAFWHHPPYVKSNYDSDRSTVFIEMRQNFLPILEDAGVDLVLTGHSHNYHRSYLIDGHYGTSDTLTDAMIKDRGDGREEGTGPYRKSLGTAAHEGAVYIVAGSSGQLTSTIARHPVMYTWKAALGSLVLDFNGNRVDVKFLRETGAVDDWFTIVKGTGLPVATVRAEDGTASEEGSDPASFVVSRTGSTAAPLVVRLSVSGTAAPGADYAAIPSSVTIPAGAVSTTVRVVPVDDREAEGDETVLLTVAPDPAYIVGTPGTAQAAIRDNDASSPPPPPPGPAAGGLLGRYFNTWNLQGPSLPRIDPVVDFDWGAGSPMPGINPDGFGVRWTGFVTPPETGTYTFYTVSNDGARLWVNDEIVIDKGIDQPLTEWSGMIDLEGGRRYRIRLEYYDNTGEAAVRLLWSGPATPKGVIPSDRLEPAEADAPPPPPPAGEPPAPADPGPAAGAGGGGGGSGGAGRCGALGWEALLVWAAVRRRRR